MLDNHIACDYRHWVSALAPQIDEIVKNNLCS